MDTLTSTLILSIPILMQLVGWYFYKHSIEVSDPGTSNAVKLHNELMTEFIFAYAFIFGFSLSYFLFFFAGVIYLILFIIAIPVGGIIGGYVLAKYSFSLRKLIYAIIAYLLLTEAFGAFYISLSIFQNTAPTYSWTRTLFGIMILVLIPGTIELIIGTLIGRWQRDIYVQQVIRPNRNILVLFSLIVLIGSYILIFLNAFRLVPWNSPLIDSVLILNTLIQFALVVYFIRILP